jgi:hypothetical protein
MDNQVKVQVDGLLVSLRPQLVILSLASVLSRMPVYRSCSGSTFSFACHIGMRSSRSCPVEIELNIRTRFYPLPRLSVDYSELRSLFISSDPVLRSR